jgi:capsular exopolysaccharide synthesis family protein
LLSSASLQEGKTYNVVNLSLSLAQAGEKVLLIDGDLRRPTIHQIFGLERQPGLTDCIMGISDLRPPDENGFQPEMANLSEAGQPVPSWRNVTSTITDLMLGERDIDDILKTPGLDNLHIIKAGQSFLNPAEILRSPRFKEFLREVRQFYDVIMIDTPPALTVADAFEVAPEVDGVVLVYEVGRIGRGILRRAKMQFESIQTNVLGVILNNVKPDVAPDIYPYRYDYYYGGEGDKERTIRPRHWWELIGQPLGWVSSSMRLAPATARRHLSILALVVAVGLLSAVGLFRKNQAGPRFMQQKSMEVTSKAASGTDPSEANESLSNASYTAELTDAIRPPVPESLREIPEEPPATASIELARVEPAPSASKTAKESSPAEGPALPPPDVAKTSSLAPEPVSPQAVRDEFYETRVFIAKIRSRPDLGAAVLQRVPQGTKLRSMGIEGDWLKLKLRNGGTGWIYNRLVQLIREPAEQPLVALSDLAGPAPTSVPPNVLGQTPLAEEIHSSLKRVLQICEVMPGVARIRSRPDIHSPVLQRVRQGTRLHVISRDGDWLKLKLKNGGTGWIYHSLVQEVDNTPTPPPV